MRHRTSVDAAPFGKHASPALPAFRRIHLSACYSLIMGIPLACLKVWHGGHEMWPPGIVELLGYGGKTSKPHNLKTTKPQTMNQCCINYQN